MAVEDEKIIQKMIHELQQALEVNSKPNTLVQHVSNVKVLCELIIENGMVDKGNTKISADEMKAMIGESQTKGETTRSSELNHEDANGKSLFDF